MVTLQRVREGVLSYIDNEVLPKMSGTGRVLVAVYAALAADRVVDVVQEWMKLPAIQVLGLCGENGMVDAERLRGCLLDKMGQEKIDLNIPMVGRMTFNREDVEKLFRYIL